MAWLHIAELAVLLPPGLGLSPGIRLLWKPSPLWCGESGCGSPWSSCPHGHICGCPRKWGFCQSKSCVPLFPPHYPSSTQSQRAPIPQHPRAKGLTHIGRCTATSYSQRPPRDIPIPSPGSSEAGLLLSPWMHTAGTGILGDTGGTALSSAPFATARWEVQRELCVPGTAHSSCHRALLAVG